MDFCDSSQSSDWDTANFKPRSQIGWVPEVTPAKKSWAWKSPETA